MTDYPVANGRPETSPAVEPPSSTEDGHIIRLAGITKHYGPTLALHNAELAVRPGEIIGVVGHNGAGKSTLMRVATGITIPDEGRIVLDGQDVAGAYSLGKARAAGIRIAFQELSLCPDLTVFENVLVAHGALGSWGWRRRASSLIMRQLDLIFPGHGIRAGQRVISLSLAQRQMAEIAQATVVVETPLRLLILDEPTAALGQQAAENLFKYLKDMKAQGLSAVLISHRLPDILQNSDRTVVMRDGGMVAERKSHQLTRRELVALMGGESAPSQVEKQEITAEAERVAGSQPLVEVRNLTSRALKNVSMEVRPGEIVGLAGLIGHGQHDFLMALWHLGAGESHVETRHVTLRSPLAYVTGDRQVEGVFPLWSVAQNLSVTALHRLRRLLGLLSVEAESKLAEDWISRLDIRGRQDFQITSLSGGSQQKVLVARALASEARVILLDDPYRGVDVGTKGQLYQMMRDEARSGRSFIWFTSENEELTECDRAYVFHDGAIVKVLVGDEIKEEHIIAASFEHQEEVSPGGATPAGSAPETGGRP